MARAHAELLLKDTVDAPSADRSSANAVVRRASDSLVSFAATSGLPLAIRVVVTAKSPMRFARFSFAYKTSVAGRHRISGRVGIITPGRISHQPTNDAPQGEIE